MENSTRFSVRHMVWSREDTKVGDREEMISSKTAAETLNTEIKKRRCWFTHAYIANSKYVFDVVSVFKISHIKPAKTIWWITIICGKHIHTNIFMLSFTLDLGMCCDCWCSQRFACSTSPSWLLNSPLVQTQFGVSVCGY